MPNSHSWTWGKVADGVPATPVSFALTAGEHRLRFMTREPGAQVDRVIITTDANASPPFIGKPDANQLEAEDGTVTAPMLVVRADEVVPPRMKVFMHAAQPIRFAIDAYGTHPRVKASTKAAKPEFAAVMLPLPGHIPDPDVRFQAQRHGLRITVAWGTRTDEIVWPTEGNRSPAVRWQ
jgi:hypothetical protein